MTRNAATTAATVLTSVLAVGCALLALGHSGVSLGSIDRLGPGDGRVVVPAAIGFAVATVVLATVAFGLSRQRAWAWSLGLVVHGIVLVSAAFPFRGAGSVAGIVLAGAAAVVLLSPPARSALLRPDEGTT